MFTIHIGLFLKQSSMTSNVTRSPTVSNKLGDACTSVE